MRHKKTKVLTIKGRLFLFSPFEPAKAFASLSFCAAFATTASFFISSASCFSRCCDFAFGTAAGAATYDGSIFGFGSAFGFDSTTTAAGVGDGAGAEVMSSTSKDSNNPGFPSRALWSSEIETTNPDVNIRLGRSASTISIMFNDDLPHVGFTMCLPRPKIVAVAGRWNSGDGVKATTEAKLQIKRKRFMVAEQRF
jgi:hypothetical protein